MARGQKYGEEIKEKAYALADSGRSICGIARDLAVPRSTVKGWLSQREATEDPEREEIRRKNKEQFVRDAWRSIHAGNKILTRRLERAAEREEELDGLLRAFSEEGASFSSEQMRELMRQFSAIKVEDIGKLAVTLGTLYDKQALIAKEVTEIIEVERKFEDF